MIKFICDICGLEEGREEKYRNIDKQVVTHNRINDFKLDIQLCTNCYGETVRKAKEFSDNADKSFKKWIKDEQIKWEVRKRDKK